MEQMSATLSLHNYRMVSIIGSGGFSSVYKIYSVRYDLHFAAKIIPIKGFKQPFEHEVQALMGLNHPNIIKMYEHFQDSEYLYIVFDYCPNGSLMDVIDTRGFIPEPRLLQIFREICTALRHCHSRNVAHHDIKPANVLVDRYNRCVLADFGLSQVGNMTRDTMGSRVFMAPEQIRRVDEEYDPMKADIWSLGVSLFMMATGDVPWPLTSIDDLDDAITNAKLSFPPDLRPELTSLIAKMLSIDPNQRPTVDQILRLNIFPQQVMKYGSGKSIRAMKGELVFGLKKQITIPDITKSLHGVTCLKSPLVAQRVFDGRRKKTSTPMAMVSLLVD